MKRSTKDSISHFQKGVEMEHIRCPLHRYTFKVRPIRDWVERHCEGKVLNLFAGKTMLNINEVRNDPGPEAIADFRMDALGFLQNWTGDKFDTVLLDPPYAYRKSMELYQGIICSPFRKLKDAIPHHLAKNGTVITFGYHSVVMGTSRGFSIEKICVFSHGGAIHDTIATVERFVASAKHHKTNGQ